MLNFKYVCMMVLVKVNKFRIVIQRYKIAVHWRQIFFSPSAIFLARFADLNYTRV